MRARTFRSAIVSSVFLLAACQTVPITGRHHLILVSESDDKQMGEQAYAETLKGTKRGDDPRWNKTLDEVGHRLARAAERPDFEWRFTMIDDPKTVNAFCLPGGKVAVYTGILPVAKDDVGLAVVLGHEIGHAIARHGAERMSQSKIAQLPSLAISVFTGDPVLRDTYQKVYGAGVNVGVLLPFSRKHESEADHIGLILMAKAGYDPRAAVAFWERMASLQKGKEDPLGKFLSTHPPDSQRIEQIKEWLPEAMRYYRAS